ncbi:type II secretion system protein GspK [Enterovibrio calviensis]|uniref:type II secretion system protein GspK n=1 Tax=Enterovibrio calviensis TaxID=91359 RepID=UPI000AFEFAA4|nr:type II secretion system protein GspK [Enterovibrio calviensis]
MIAVLGFIAVLSVLAGLVATWTEAETNRAIALRNAWQQELDVQATIATVLYTVSAGGKTVNGYGGAKTASNVAPQSDDPFVVSGEFLQHAKIQGDGTRYQGIGESVFSLQDEGSLLSLLSPDRERWGSMLSSYGLSMFETSQFLDHLEDYTDQDDFRRLNGASSADYTAAGLALPSHRLMVSPGQILNLLGGERWPWLKGILGIVTVHSGQTVQFNTMPKPVLETLHGISNQQAQLMLEERARTPFLSAADVSARTGVILSGSAMNIAQMPSKYLRIMVWSNSDKCGEAYWMGVVLTPSSNRAPWEIDYGFEYETKAVCRADSPINPRPF